MKKSILIPFTILMFLLIPIGTLPADNLLCATCGKTITGSYKQLNGKAYCSETCFQDALPKCAVCGKPASRFIRVKDDERIYCSMECLESTLLKCEICRKPLRQWVKVHDHNYCSDCARLPKCSNCRLPGAEQRLPDGRPICRECMRTAIMDEGHAQRVCKDVRDDIYTHLNLKTDHPIYFFLKDSPGLTALIRKPRQGEEGYYEFDEKYRMRNGEKIILSGTYSIYILSGLSLSNFRNAAAHELAHDIGHELFPAVQREEDVEGFAEYIASLMNRYWGSDKLNREKLQNNEKTYANGYKKFLKIAERNGLADVLDYMAKENGKKSGDGR